jgi:O-palmitoleoyl-L-serine hydrolase
MDGSSSGIYFAPATSQPDYYVLYLQGGGWCNDQNSCTSRCGSRTAAGRCSGAHATSTVWEETVSKAGLFSTSPNKTPLPGANKAFLRYCTGDAHMGNRDASAQTFGFNFHGSRTVAAALSLLVEQHGLGSRPGQTLLFGGGSAGGRGAMANLDFLPGLLRDMPVASAPRVLGFLDS